ncbi:ClpB protein [Acidisarcina polymorpha]|uniref:ClpB protein n=1 Tax=Acidisarcina polymorpha TaxID=2211140 RepID=A0A2Z5G2E4_9BACT|nr:type VI secretion system ATPase TssH [Acidisarcina polymorpha]AXC13373.1 ClpB protein [Acidisarcina polymorpha]
MIASVKPLVAKFNDTTRQVMEGAAGLCLSRTNYEVEIEHFLAKALELEKTDLALIVDHYGVSRSRLAVELRASLDRLKTGNARGPAFSPALIKMFGEAWAIGSLTFDSALIRTGHTLLGLLNEDGLARMLRDISKELARIPFATLLQEFHELTERSIEADSEMQQPSTANKASQRTSAAKTPFLDQYTIDLTGEARAGRIEAVVGRDGEIRQMIDILMRRRQNNPILTGEAGVGKTAVVEGLARRIADGDVPAVLERVRLHSLDLTLLQAGAGVKGEFENRLKGLIQEVKASPQPVILFIDEAHTMIGAGGQQGQGDAANILKPALARGELRTIAATTWVEYKRYFEKDAALTRRFQVVQVDEPSEPLCESMLRSIAPSLEKHHSTRILDEAISAAVRLSHRYLPGRQLPDKAVSVLDTACARVALSEQTDPAAVEALVRRITAFESQKRLLLREQATGSQHAERIAACDEQIRIATADLQQLRGRWAQETELVQRMKALHAGLESSDSLDAEERSAALNELEGLRSQLRALQSQAPLTYLAVDAQIVASVISEWTGIPLGKMMDDEIVKVLSLETELKRRVVGQDHALAAIAQRIWTSRANLDDPGKPIGVFMLAGPSGVGKTETALALAEVLYGGEDSVVTINMSEFQEPHSVSTLKGAPPGYVGYGEGGVLTEAIRRQPYSVVLLDEVEKAHPDVLELFFQVFDKGHIEDGEGRWIDFRNTLILLTTNAASGLISKLCAQSESMPLPAELATSIRPELNRIFKPAFLGRTLVVPYYPVKEEVLKHIIRLKLGKIEDRLATAHRVHLQYDDELVELVRQRCIEVESGARNIDHLLSNTLLPEISRSLLAGMAEGESLEQVRVGVSETGEFTYTWTQSKDAPDSQTYTAA